MTTKQYIALGVTWILLVVLTLVVVSYILTPKQFGYQVAQCTYLQEMGGKQYCAIPYESDNKPLIFTK